MLCSTPSQVQCANNLATSRIENSSGLGFDPLNAGPTAQNVPAHALIVDNIDPAMIYHDKFQWLSRSDYVDMYASVSYTSIPGASLSYSFDGVAIWCDCVSHVIRWPTSRIGFTVVSAITAGHSRYRLMVRQRSGRVPQVFGI